MRKGSAEGGVSWCGSRGDAGGPGFEGRGPRVLASLGGRAGGWFGGGVLPQAVFNIKGRDRRAVI